MLSEKEITPCRYKSHNNFYLFIYLFLPLKERFYTRFRVLFIMITGLQGFSWHSGFELIPAVQVGAILITLMVVCGPWSRRLDAHVDCGQWLPVQVPGCPCQTRRREKSCFQHWVWDLNVIDYVGVQDCNAICWSPWSLPLLFNSRHFKIRFIKGTFYLQRVILLSLYLGNLTFFAVFFFSNCAEVMACSFF